jgi:hypothetical protein
MHHQPRSADPACRAVERRLTPKDTDLKLRDEVSDAIGALVNAPHRDKGGQLSRAPCDRCIAGRLSQIRICESPVGRMGAQTDRLIWTAHPLGSPGPGMRCPKMGLGAGDQVKPRHAGDDCRRHLARSNRCWTGYRDHAEFTMKPATCFDGQVFMHRRGASGHTNDCGNLQFYSPGRGRFN